MNGRRNIPIAWVRQLAVTEPALFDVLGLNDSRAARSASAKKKAAYRFLAAHGIKPLPGRLFPLRPIEKALGTNAEMRKR